MSISTLTSTTLLLGTAWTGTAPGAPGTQTISGTINSGSGTYVALTAYTNTAGFDADAAMQDGTTFGAGGFVLNYAGLKSGMLNVTFLADYASGSVMDKLNTMGLGATVYFDLTATSSARGTSNPSYVGAVVLSKLPFINSQVGNLPAITVSWPCTGAYTTLTS